MSNLSAAKALLTPGTQWDVTNHYITRPDHPCYGTARVSVTRTTGSRVYYDGSKRYADWPKASQVQVDSDGTVRLYGGGAAQESSDLFLTFRPA